MSKGSKRRPQQVTDKELVKNWKEIFDNFDPSKKQQILREEKMRGQQILSCALYDRFKQSLKKNGRILMAAAVKAIQDTVTGKGIDIPKYKLFASVVGDDCVAVNRESGELIIYNIQIDLSRGAVYKTYNGSFFWEWKSKEFYIIYESLGVL
jgi:predicted GH43/DUF377 family glycosyl hydrolase